MKKNKKEMRKEMKKESKDKVCGVGSACHHGCGGAVYGLGFIGAAVYYISQSTGFWMGVLGILKAIVWPAFIVFDALKFLAV